MMHQKKLIFALSAALIITCSHISASQNENEKWYIREQILSTESPAIQDARGYARIMALAGGFAMGHGLREYFSAHFSTINRLILKRQALLPIGMSCVLVAPLAILTYDLEHKVNKQIKLNKQFKSTIE